MILVKTKVRNEHGALLAVVAITRPEPNEWHMTVFLTEQCPDGPDMLVFRYWDAKTVRVCHDGTVACWRAERGIATTWINPEAHHCFEPKESSG